MNLDRKREVGKVEREGKKERKEEGWRTEDGGMVV